MNLTKQFQYEVCEKKLFEHLEIASYNEFPEAPLEMDQLSIL